MGKIVWIKVEIDMFDDEKIKLIDSMNDRDSIHYVWMRLLIQAGKTNSAGNIFLNEDIPYSNEMLSIIFNRPVKVIDDSLRILSELNMIEIDKKNFIRIINWEKHQNVEGMEKIREQARKRVAKHRAKKKLEGESMEDDNSNNRAGDKVKEVYNLNNEYECDDKNLHSNNAYNNEEIFQEELQKNAVTNCNVTVTPQNKMEKKKKLKNKKEIKSIEDSEEIRCIRNNIVTKEIKDIEGSRSIGEVEGSRDSSGIRDIESIGDSRDSRGSGELGGNIDRSSVCELQTSGSIEMSSNGLMDKSFECENIDMDLTEDFNKSDIVKYIKSLGVKIIGGNEETVKLAVSIYGASNVKLAIQKALEVNKPRMNYVNGILKNWKSEAEQSNNYKDSVCGNLRNDYSKTKILKFNDFEARSYDYDKLEKSLLGW
ncbi:hypothetical protein UT300005_14840 [Clostridium sp. CTA-5]